MAAVAMLYNPQSKHDQPLARGGCPVRFLSGLYELDRLGLALRRQAAQVGWDHAERSSWRSAMRGTGWSSLRLRTSHWPSRSWTSFTPASISRPWPKCCIRTTKRQPRRKRLSGATNSSIPAGLRCWPSGSALDVARWSDERRESYRQEVQYCPSTISTSMDYPRYVANGWQIGSGPFESGCKTPCNTSA